MATSPAPILQHEYYKCPATCDGCHICNGGLLLCVICHQGEGELEPSCPGPKRAPSAAALEVRQLASGRSEITLEADRYDRLFASLGSTERFVDPSDTRIHFMTSALWGAKVVRQQETEFEVCASCDGDPVGSNGSICNGCEGACGHEVPVAELRTNHHPRPGGKAPNCTRCGRFCFWDFDSGSWMCSQSRFDRTTNQWEHE